MPHSSQTRNKKLNICAVYLPPPVSCDMLENELNNISNAMALISDKEDTILVGDFNLEHLIWYQNPDCEISAFECNRRLSQLLFDFQALNNLLLFNLVKNKNDIPFSCNILKQ
ncbi:unnamed protein product [Leptidea sinapis]|uniref:Endonuclease/exonuclease/phosphatase domain-containing protein n=1 Tax=Leptidea sinapis TaxID=189913 RepID=A0A5E4QXA8_9NEOP|nr:unnamed protein product [Leptidea sinapis]